MSAGCRVEVGLEHRFQGSRRRMPAGLDRGHPDRFIFVGQLGQGGRQELVFALEVEIDDPRGKPCSACHMVKGRACVTMPSDAADCGFNQDRKSTRLNSSHLGISYAALVPASRSFPTRRSSDLDSIAAIQIDSYSSASLARVAAKSWSLLLK